MKIYGDVMPWLEVIKITESDGNDIRIEVDNGDKNGVIYLDKDKTLQLIQALQSLYLKLK